jgi:hypothetical protein
MEQIHVLKKDDNAFGRYLNTSMNNTFTLDLANYSVIEYV